MTRKFKITTKNSLLKRRRPSNKNPILWISIRSQALKESKMKKMSTLSARSIKNLSANSESSMRWQC